MLGKDAAKSEYWHFKDDNTRLYIRMEKEVPIGNGDEGEAVNGQKDAQMTEQVDVEE